MAAGALGLGGAATSRQMCPASKQASKPEQSNSNAVQFKAKQASQLGKQASKQSICHGLPSCVFLCLPSSTLVDQLVEVRQVHATLCKCLTLSLCLPLSQLVCPCVSLCLPLSLFLCAAGRAQQDNRGQAGSPLCLALSPLVSLHRSRCRLVEVGRALAALSFFVSTRTSHAKSDGKVNYLQLCQIHTH